MDTGTYIKVIPDLNFNSVNGDNSLVYRRVLYMQMPTGDWADAGNVSDGVAAVIGGGAIAADKEYQVRILVRDELWSNVDQGEWIEDIGTSSCLFNAYKKERAALFGYAANDGFEVHQNKPIRQYGQTLDQRYRKNTDIIPVANGGTGAASASAARANLGAAPASHTHTKANITDFAHTHTPAEAGAAPASHNHAGVYVPVGGDAYPLRIGGVRMNMNWSGQGGQPPWLWGGSDGTNMYVYNPSNFSVNYANTAGGLSSYAAVLNLVYPVGSIYMSTSATNPGSLFGGSWERYAVGRVLVGVSEGEGEWYYAGQTGGAKYHTLSANEMPSHNHHLKAWSYQTNASRADFYSANQNLANDNFDPNNDHIGYTGSGWGHNNMQPYVAVYIWRRIG